MLAGWVAGLDRQLDHSALSFRIAVLQASMLCTRHVWYFTCTGRAIHTFPAYQTRDQATGMCCACLCCSQPWP
jgi:hypothetical protein